MLIQSLGSGPDLEARVFGLSDLAVNLTSTYIDHGKEFGYLSPNLDSVATARAIVSMIVGSAFLSLNPATGKKDRSRTLEAIVSLMFDGISKS